MANERFTAAIEEDLNLPRAMAVVWDMLRGSGRSAPDERRLALLAACSVNGWDALRICAALGVDVSCGLHA